MIDKTNAAIRENICSDIYEAGVRQKKQIVLEGLGEDLSKLHDDCKIHIHDLDTFGDVYNCSMPLLKQYLLAEDIVLDQDTFKIAELFSRQKRLITELAINQSGGIGFNNYDIALGDVFDSFKVILCKENISVLEYYISDFLIWINTTKTRYCREPYYITLNIGLAQGGWGKVIAEKLLDVFFDIPMEYTRPNIVFKVLKRLHLQPNAINEGLFLKAIQCTGYRMIPTYMLMDSEVNACFDPKEIGIMGCRTRVASNINGISGSNGRGNIGNVSINLPRIAMESNTVKEFFDSLYSVMEKVHRILRIRADLLIKSNGKYIDFVLKNNLWHSIESVNDIVMQGTLSIGYIGLSESVEVLTSQKFYKDENAYELALKIVKFMRNYVDEITEKEKMNYSLLASPGEMISGRFCTYDKKLFHHTVNEKGFYTNSFHVDVDSKLSVLEKIEKEAPFHILNNGGCITYVELREAINQNTLAIKDIIEYAIEKKLSYVGINYPLDICNECGQTGTFDICIKCGSRSIKHIRRVSGYLEDLTYFTDGKRAEVESRKANI